MRFFFLLLHMLLVPGILIPGKLQAIDPPKVKAMAEPQAAIYRAYVREDMALWKQTMDATESRWDASSEREVLEQLVEMEYGYTGWLLGIKENKQARVLVEKALDQIDFQIGKGFGSARLFCLKGSFHSYQARLEFHKAKGHMEQVRQAYDRAFELDPDEPQVWLGKANMEFYVPRMFGGSKERSVPLYRKAVELYEKDAQQVVNNWLYLSALTNLAQSYEETGRIDEAGDLFRRILEMEPHYKWVVKELYPAFCEKHPGK